MKCLVHPRLFSHPPQSRRIPLLPIHKSPQFRQARCHLHQVRCFWADNAAQLQWWQHIYQESAVPNFCSERGEVQGFQGHRLTCLQMGTGRIVCPQPFNTDWVGGRSTSSWHLSSKHHRTQVHPSLIPNPKVWLQSKCSGGRCGKFDFPTQLPLQLRHTRPQGKP